MKKIVFIVALLSCLFLTQTSFAQDDQEKKLKDEKIQLDKKFKTLNDEIKKSEEIIIRKKGDKDAKITVEIKGDNIMINGKPLADYIDDNITIDIRKILRDNNGMKSFYRDIPDDLLSSGNDFEMMNDEKSYPFLGVSTDKVDDGAKIEEVTKESPAEKAGLKAGDIITMLNNKKIDGPQTLSEMVKTFKPKDEVTVYYKRDGKKNSVKAVLGERKNSNTMVYSFSGPGGNPKTFVMPKMKQMQPFVWDSNNGDNNFDFNYNVSPRQQKLGLKIQDTEDGNGVKILDIDKDSPAEKAGLMKDDILTEVGGQKVTNTDEARDQLHENQDKSTYSIKVKRNGKEMNFEIKIPKKLKTADL